MTGLSGNETTWRQIRNILAFFAIVLFLALMKLMASIIIPFVIAIFVFLIVNPVLLRLDKLKVPKIISMLLTMLLVGCVLVGLVYIFFVIVDMLVQPDGLPAYVARVQALDRSLSEMIAPYIDEDPMTFSILSRTKCSLMTSDTSLTGMQAGHCPSPSGAARSDDASPGISRDCLCVWPVFRSSGFTIGRMFFFCSTSRNGRCSSGITV